MAEVMLDNIEKVYRGGAHALRGLSLRVREGELLAVVGPSGSGKSTLLRVIAGLESPTRGRVLLDSEDVTTLPPHRRGVAMVMQSYALYPHLTVARNLTFGLRGVSRAEAKERARSAASALGIGGLMHRMPGELSGGERQRAALAKAMARRPRVFLFDEPLSNLDARLRERARREIKALHGRLGATMIYITHDQEEALAIGDRVAVLHEGALQQMGAPEEVYGSPANIFVAGFIGSPGMNLLPGRVEIGRRGPEFVEDGPGGAELSGGVGPLRIVLELEGAGKLAGSRAVAGVRGRDLRPAKDGAGVALRVSLIEPLGAGADITGELPSGASLVLRVDAGKLPKVGEVVRVEIDPGAVHLFEAGPEGKNLLAGRAAAGSTGETRIAGGVS